MATAEVNFKQTQTRPRVLQPGLRLLPPGVQRYVVAGGGSIVLELAGGDNLEIVDSEGRQPCEIAAFDVNGRSDPGLLGTAADGPAAGIVRTLAAADDDARRVSSHLQRLNADLDKAQAVYVFAQDSMASDKASFTAQADNTCIIAAPAEPMLAHEQNPPTDLIVYIHRTLSEQEGEPKLPVPLADPRVEVHIDARTARAYEVKTGEFIQVIDVQGRQCSDFQGFEVAALDDGVERCLDATTTRSLMGAAYPGPGLYSKFFDVNMCPLVEVVQDTVGRHDTFNLACTSKYYEDMGYPGHVNCTENFNKELSTYNVAARRGWEAINFFYNTNVDANNQLYFDEPWSRPGDYVLLRALNDMVCISSACPCDIDAANGWNPTDIHVRVYPPENTFKKAIAYRMTTDADKQLTKETGFHPRTSQHTRNFVEYNGYWLPNSFTKHGAIDEYWACRERAVVIDLSPLRKFEVVGPDAELLMQTCVTRNVRRLTPGQVVYTAMCYDTGGMIDDGTLYRLASDNFRWIGGADASGLWLRQQAHERGLRVWVKNSTDQLHNLQVQGPSSRDILKKVVWTRPDQPTIEELQWFRFSSARIDDELGIPIVVSRTGYTGELGFEVFCHPKDAPAVWDAIWEAGQPHGLIPLGLEALDILRIEAGLIFAGYEFTDQTDPFEAGISFTVPLKSKEDDFIGKEALIKRKANPQHVLVGLELEGGEPAALNDSVHVGRNQVGTVTSGARSPKLGRNIALCRMAVEYSEIGTEVEVGKIDGHQKRIPATVVPFPFYDPKKERVRS